MLGIVQTVLVDIVIERSAAIYIEEHTHVRTIGAESDSESGKTQFWIEIYLLFLENRRQTVGHLCEHSTVSSCKAFRIHIVRIVRIVSSTQRPGTARGTLLATR